MGEKLQHYFIYMMHSSRSNTPMFLCYSYRGFYYMQYVNQQNALSKIQ